MFQSAWYPCPNVLDHLSVPLCRCYHRLYPQWGVYSTVSTENIDFFAKIAYKGLLGVYFCCCCCCCSRPEAGSLLDVGVVKPDPIKYLKKPKFHVKPSWFYLPRLKPTFKTCHIIQFGPHPLNLPIFGILAIFA